MGEAPRRYRYTARRLWDCRRRSHPTAFQHVREGAIEIVVVACRLTTQRVDGSVDVMLRQRKPDDVVAAGLVTTSVTQAGPWQLRHPCASHLFQQPVQQVT